MVKLYMPEHLRDFFIQLCLMTVTYPEDECIKWQAVLKYLCLTMRERSGRDGESLQPGYGPDASGDVADV